MSTLRLRAVGDNLLHKQVIEAARQEDGSYRFDEMFDPVRPLIEEADVAVINQETIYVKDRRKISSFPFFGSPTEAGDAIARAGFDIVTHATNHALDKGYQGIRDTVGYWENSGSGVRFTGIHTGRRDQDTIRYIKRRGIRLAILNYTESLNYHIIPPLSPWCIDVMKHRTREKIARQIAHAREKADAVVIFPHWGCEYLYEPVDSQVEWAQFFADAGADLIIGTHPHVLQNIETVAAKDGRKVPCLYSLGNFLACQIIQGTMLGGMADVVITIDDGKLSIEKAEIIPLVIHADPDYAHFASYPLADYSDELAAENKIFAVMKERHGWEINVAYLRKLYEDIMAKNAMKDSIYHSPKDVRAQNVRAVLRAVTGRSSKG